MSFLDFEPRPTDAISIILPLTLETTLSLGELIVALEEKHDDEITGLAGRICSINGSHVTLSRAYDLTIPSTPTESAYHSPLIGQRSIQTRFTSIRTGRDAQDYLSKYDFAPFPQPQNIKAQPIA